MTVEECNTALYEKLFESQEKLRGWLLSQPPEEILKLCIRVHHAGGHFAEPGV